MLEETAAQNSLGNLLKLTQLESKAEWWMSSSLMRDLYPWMLIMNSFPPFSVPLHPGTSAASYELTMSLGYLRYYLLLAVKSRIEGTFRARILAVHSLTVQESYCLSLPSTFRDEAARAFISAFCCSSEKEFVWEAVNNKLKPSWPRASGGNQMRERKQTARQLTPFIRC